MADWNFYMPLERDEELVKGERKHIVRGIASTESEDNHGEEMILAGMDFDPYLEKGRLNYDHMKGPSYQLGRPLDAKIVTSIAGLDFRKMAKAAINGPAFFHMCELYDTEPGRHAWELLKAEEDDPNRDHGFSVEGAILQTHGRKLSKTRVDDVALTPKPANRDTFAELVKSLSKNLSFEDSGDALGLQYIDDNRDQGARINQAVEGFRNLEGMLWGTCDNGCLNKNMQFVRGSQSAYLHLVKCRGIPEGDAYRFVKNLAKSGIF